MRKRGNNANTNSNGSAGNLPLRGSNGSSLAVSKLLSQQQPYRDGQTVILDVREPVLAGSNHNNNKNHAMNSSNSKDDVSAQLNAKNHRLAKELSEVRVRHREECKNVTRLTMENMSLASRCREAITQAANMKKDLSLQKRKTAEAVAQTHILLDQLKKMKYALNALEAEKAKNTDPTASSRNSSSNSSPQQEQQNVVNSSAAESPGMLIDDGKAIDPNSNLAAFNFLGADSVPVVASAENDTQQLQLTPNNHSSTKQQSGNSEATTTTVASTISSTISSTSESNEYIPVPILINSNEMITATDNHDVKISSNSPSTTTTTIVRESPAAASDVLSKVSNIVDLDVSLDDDQPNAPVIVHEQGIDEETPLFPTDAQIVVNESHFDNVGYDDNINRSQNGPTVNSSFPSEEYSDVNKKNHILPTELDDNFARVDVNCSQNDDDVQATKSNNLPAATRLIMEENFDDSEHKSEDDFYRVASSANDTFGEKHDSLSIDVDIIYQNNPLISSDDYEMSVSDDIDDTAGTENKNAVASTPSNLEDQSVAMLAASTCNNHVPKATILKSELESNGSTIHDNEKIELLFDGKVIGTEILAVKESNTNLSWVEDYDEAAELMGDETYDTLSGLKSPSKKEIFPYSASPKISINSTSGNTEFVSSDSLSTMTKRFALPPSSLNDSYEEEFPSDIIDPHSLTNGITRHNKLKFRSSLMNATTEKIEEQVEKCDDDQESSGSPIKLLGPLQERGSTNLLSSIDAFEASFRTNFPDSFTSKDSPVTSPSSGIRPVKDTGILLANNTFTTKLCDERIDQKPIFEDVAKTEKDANDTIQKPVAEIAKSWGNAMLDRATFTSQRSGARRSSKLINSIEEPSVNTSLSTSKNLSSSQEEAISTPIVTGASDQSARWLMEVKASTAKNKLNAESMVDEAMSRLLATKLDHEKGANSADSINYASTLNRNNTNRKLFSINNALQSELSNQNEPVFRQFPRTASPVKPIKHSASRINKIDFIDDAFSEPMSDRAPLLRGRYSDEYESPQSATSIQQKNKNGSATSDAKTRYMVAIGQQGSASKSSNRGRSFASRQIQIPNEGNSVSLLNLDKDSTHSVASASTDCVNIATEGNAIPGAAVQSSPDSVKKALNSKTAPYSNNYINRSSGRGALRATVMLLEDEGDIPMETNLSPRKIRNDDHSNVSSFEKEKASSPEQDSSFSTRVDTALRNHQRLKARAQASASEWENRAALTQSDDGKQRRHINLSGTGRLIRQIDPENNTSPIYDIGHRDEK